ncbi:MAG: hypothetical protein V3T53_12350 [Phycisphaerales bacterium]
MAASLNALGLMGVVALTLLAIFVRKPQRCSLKLFVRSVLLAIAAVILANVASFHMCYAGHPVTQWLIPSVCILLAGLFARVNWLRRVAVAILMIAAIQLSFYFTSIVHMKGFTGNPSSGERVRRTYLRVLREDLVDSGLDTQQHFPSGWLRDIVDEELEVYAGSEHLSALGIVSHVWHTSLTRIYRVTNVPADVWYPGGVLADSLVQIELRARPKS